MSLSERKKAKRITFEYLMCACNEYGRVHMRTSAGTWCIPVLSQVTRIESSEQTRREQKRNLRTGKAA